MREDTNKPVPGKLFSPRPAEAPSEGAPALAAEAGTGPEADTGDPASSGAAEPLGGPGATAPGRMALVQARLIEAVQARKQELGLLEGVIKSLRDGDPGKVARQLDQALLALPTGPAAQVLLEELAGVVDDERVSRREGLSRALKDACTRQGVGFRVVAREPLIMLRLAPLAVRLDKDKSYADLLFSGERLETVPAEAEAILDGWRRVVHRLEGEERWDPEAFHHLLWRAWRHSLVEEEREQRPDWVEINAVFSMLELLRPRRTEHNRARFAWDLYRLRRDRRLFDRGWRLVIGAATGASTKDKRRVWWLEDAEGNGQYHLTLKFVPQERPGAEGPDAPSESHAEGTDAQDNEAPAAEKMEGSS